MPVAFGEGCGGAPWPRRLPYPATAGARSDALIQKVPPDGNYPTRIDTKLVNRCKDDVLRIEIQCFSEHADTVRGHSNKHALLALETDANKRHDRPHVGVVARVENSTVTKTGWVHVTHNAGRQRLDI